MHNDWLRKQVRSDRLTSEDANRGQGRIKGDRSTSKYGSEGAMSTKDGNEGMNIAIADFFQYHIGYCEISE